MSIKKLSLALTLSFAVSLNSAFAGSAKFFASFDYFGPTGIEDDVSDIFSDYQTGLTDFGIASSFDITATGGVGGRMGIGKLFHPNFFGAVSIGYISGPEIDGAFQDRDLFLPGTIDVEIKTEYLRVLAEGLAKLPVSKSVELNLGIGAGLAKADADLDYEGRGFYQGTDYRKEEDKIGASVEVSPSIQFNLNRVSLITGARYAIFPEVTVDADTSLDALTESYGIDWTALGFFVGVMF